MNKIISVILCCVVATPALALTPAGQSRRSVQAQMVGAANRATASKAQISSMATMSVSSRHEIWVLLFPLPLYLRLGPANQASNIFAMPPQANQCYRQKRKPNMHVHNKA